jgi:hypothetical protein
MYGYHCTTIIIIQLLLYIYPVSYPVSYPDTMSQLLVIASDKYLLRQPEGQGC